MRYTLNLSAQSVEIVSLGLSKLFATREVVETINDISAQIAVENKAARVMRVPVTELPVPDQMQRHKE